ncbi:hypothetical protein EV715DRAFT_175309, partial [Schizophyllum commune]
ERSYTRALKARAFTEALDGRDVFLGQTRCVVCGAGQTGHCYIIPDTDSRTWAEAKAHGWIPAHAAELPEHPNNGLLLCATHKAEFQSKSFFIRYLPELNVSSPPHVGTHAPPLLSHAPHTLLLARSSHPLLHRKFILLNLSATPHLQPFHTKAIALDPDDRNAALPTLFLLHELRARAKYPFQSVDAVLPPAGSSEDIEWQDWITSSGIVRSGASS